MAQTPPASSDPARRPTSPPAQEPSPPTQEPSARRDGAETARHAGSRAAPPAAPRDPRSAARAPETPPAVRVPERPKLGEGVRPAGQMQESAFVDPPWLLDREGLGFIQVTELLYRVAEHCDGQNTLEEIAKKVSEATGRDVSADNVKTLIEKQLIPKGLLVREGTGSETEIAAAGATERSPLAISMKMAMVPPKVLDPFTRVLGWLFWPPILIGVLILAGAAQAWMYLIHGVGGSLHDALYAPGLLLAVLGVIVLSAAFHELGHAAALTYGGGKVRGMGFGIYIVYPAFYTDVSDNYKLRRWPRVRTDLGGFYFNLIFALGVMAAYVATGWEVLLLIVALINIEMIHQLLPFGRLDGYWTLADVTGVPDFFSQMAAFVRSNLPFLKWEGRKLPELKWWAKAVFFGYILITVPLLLFLLFITLTNTPSILATAWDSLGQQAVAFNEAWQGGQLLAMAAAVVHVIALGLPTLGLLYTFYNLGKRLVVAVWNWSKPTPTRRVVGALGSAAAAGLLVYLWSPNLPFGRGGPGPAYSYASTNFQPISRQARGTVFDAVGAPQPNFVTPLETRQPEPTPAPSATGEPTPAPAGEPTPAATIEPTPGATVEPTPAPTAEPTMEPTPAPTTAPAAPPASIPKPLPPTSPPVAPVPPAPAVAPTTPPVAPTTAPAIAPTTAPAIPPTTAPVSAPTTPPVTAPTAAPAAPTPAVKPTVITAPATKPAVVATPTPAR